MDRWIVVGIDFSDGAIRALDYAIEQAKAIGASVACVHAYEGAPGMRASDDPTERIRQQLNEVIARSTPTSSKLRIDSLVRRGPPWEKLANVATELGADMIVIGADGQRGAASQGFVGTVASRLITTSRRSVVVVPAPLRPDGKGLEIKGWVPPSVLLKIAIIVGTTRPGRKAASVAEWAYEIARKRTDAAFTILDLATFELPILDEPLPATSGSYEHPHTKTWSTAIASFDGFVFVTPEYNHGPSGALKNAIDFLYREWLDKAAGFIGYGYTMGARAIENLRLVMASLQVATVRPQVGLSLFTDFESATVFNPTALQEQALTTMLDHVVAWSRAMRGLREPKNHA